MPAREAEPCQSWEEKRPSDGHLVDPESLQAGGPRGTAKKFVASDLGGPQIYHAHGMRTTEPPVFPGRKGILSTPLARRLSFDQTLRQTISL